MRTFILFIGLSILVTGTFAQGKTGPRGKSSLNAINKNRLAIKSIGKAKFYLVKDKDLKSGRNVLAFPSGVKAYFTKNSRGAQSVLLKKNKSAQTIRFTSSLQGGNNSFASSNGGNKYTCDNHWCACVGDKDCNKMVSGTACASNNYDQPKGFCYEKNGVTHCVCVQE